MLITTEQLAGHLDDPEWVVIDTRHELMDPVKGRKAYEAGHIPGAHFMSVDEDLSGAKTGKTGRHPLPDLATFAARVNELGIGPETQVVVYDDAGGTFAVRLWWMLRWLGHGRVSLLDGGLPLWVQEGRPTSAPVPQARKGSFVPKPRLGATVDVHFVARHRGDATVKLIDARTGERFRGEQEPIDPVAGHVPGAVNRFWKQNLLQDGRFKTPSQLRAEYRDFLDGADPHRAVHMCGSGVTACHNIFAMELAGLPGGRLYPGSWSEWCADPSRPAAKGA
ncbi:MAG: sulfurtransferase [Usitatibacter sp.]